MYVKRVFSYKLLISNEGSIQDSVNILKLFYI